MNTILSRRLIILALACAAGSLLAGACLTARLRPAAGAALGDDLPGFRRLDVNAEGRPEYRHEKTGLVFVHLPGGQFEMGSPPDETGRFPTEGPVHTVRVKPFLLAKTVVTQGVWERVMSTRPWWGTAYMVNGEDYPAVEVSWNDGRAFLKKTGLRFPSEAEWEYACRAGTRTCYFFGDDERKLGEYAWYDAISWDAGRHYYGRVGRKKPNPFGLHDMHGNVWEWCEDTWHVDYKGAPSDGRAWVDDSSPHRVQRGGSWICNPWNLRSASRIRNVPTFRNGHLGIRPAFSLPSSP